MTELLQSEPGPNDSGINSELRIGPPAVPSFVPSRLRSALDHWFYDPLRIVLDRLISSLHLHERSLQEEAREREGAQRDIQTLSKRLDGFEAHLTTLNAQHRLARLERDRVPVAAIGAAGPVNTPQSGTVGPGLDYFAFEARFRGSEEAIRARQQVYLDVLAGRNRVLDVGCGRGELLELLRERHISAYGIEVEPDFLALLEEKGLDVFPVDAISHLEQLASGSVDAIVASHVVEHLDSHSLVRFLRLAAERLTDDGLLILETPNPESLTAGSINFHRDPTHVRPIHPDTLQFLAETSGFDDVQVQRMSPVPDHLQLPELDAETDPLVAHVNALTRRLNALLFGFQDYAVIARRQPGQGSLQGLSGLETHL